MYVRVCVYVRVCAVREIQRSGPADSVCIGIFVQYVTPRKFADLTTVFNAESTRICRLHHAPSAARLHIGVVINGERVARFTSIVIVELRAEKRAARFGDFVSFAGLTQIHREHQFYSGTRPESKQL